MDMMQPNANMKMNVKGIAIRPGMSKNGIMYTKEELDKFAPTMIGKPILKDHFSAVDNTVGIVDNGYSANGVVNYNGWIKEDGTNLLEKVKDGRAKEVSIGAFVGRLVKDDDNSDVMMAIDLQCMELSITPTPGVVGTSLQQSLESIETKRHDSKAKVLPVFESFENSNSHVEAQEVIQMTEEKKIETPAIVEKAAEKVAEKIVEEKKTISVNVDSSGFDVAIEKAEKLLLLKEKLKETQVPEVKEVVETKGKIAKEDAVKQAEVAEEYVMEASEYGKGVSLWKQPKADGTY